MKLSNLNTNTKTIEFNFDNKFYQHNYDTSKEKLDKEILNPEK